MNVLKISSPGNVLKASSPGNTAVEDGFKALLGMYLAQPRRAQASQYYLRTYWETNIEATFTAEWAAKREAAMLSGAKEPEVTVNDRMDVARRLLKQEPEEFQKRIRDEVEEEYRKVKEEYKEKFRLAPIEGQTREW